MTEQTNTPKQAAPEASSVPLKTAGMLEAAFQIHKVELPAFTDIRLDGYVVPIEALSARILIPFAEAKFIRDHGAVMAVQLLELVYSHDLAGQDVLTAFLRLSGYRAAEDAILLDTLESYEAPVDRYEYHLRLTLPAGLNQAGEAIIPAFASTFVLASPGNAPLIRAIQLLGLLYDHRATDLNLLRVQLRAAGHKPRPSCLLNTSSDIQGARFEGDHAQ